MGLVVASAAAAAAPVELTAPRQGTAWLPGATAEVAWKTVGSGFAGLEAPVEEWEAFVSVDGGLSYPFRVTPHLDIDLTRFRFPVPPVASDDVRVLLRFGNERREVGFEMPQRFSIAEPGALAALRRILPRAAVGVGRGEAARPGEPGVVMWVEGSRRGGDVRLRTATDASGGWRRAALAVPPPSLPLVPPKREGQGAPQPEPAAARQQLPRSTEVAAPLRAARVAPLLLLIQRSNC